jgi:hypothetical protein
MYGKEKQAVGPKDWQTRGACLWVSNALQPLLWNQERALLWYSRGVLDRPSHIPAGASATFGESLLAQRGYQDSFNQDSNKLTLWVDVSLQKPWERGTEGGVQLDGICRRPRQVCSQVQRIQ